MKYSFAVLLGFLSLAPADSCDEESSDDVSVGSDVGAAVLSYSNGHPLNWTNASPLALSNEDQVLSLVNHHRVSLGRNALTHDAAMRNCARGMSRHMRADIHNFFAHTNPEGDSPGDRLTKNGIPWASAGENIAAGYATPQAVVGGWLASPGHRTNIESSTWSRTGVGYQPGAGGGDYITFWTQAFAD